MIIYFFFNKIVVCKNLFILSAAACFPFSSSIIADVFVAGRRGIALSVFALGVYFGYGLSFVLVFIANLNWRVVYFVVGIPGDVTAC